MAEENTVPAGTNNSTDQSVDTLNQSETRDYEKQYLDEVENAKRLRKRAQDAESRIAEYDAKQKAAKEKKLKEEGKFQELLQEKEAMIASMEAKYEEANKIISSEKASILESFPEEDRADFEGLNLTQLRKIQKKLNVKRPTNPINQKSVVTDVTMTKPYNEMTVAERKAYHTQMISRTLK